VIPKLETPRLRLRPFTASDVPEIARLAGRAEIAATTLFVPHPYAESDAEAWLATHGPSAADGTGFTFAITTRDDRLVGAVALHPVPRHRRAELGYWIGVEHWGQGYATEAAAAVLGFGFETLGLNRIEAHAFPENPASARVLEKLGFRLEGLLRHHVVKDGLPRDGLFYSILRPILSSDPR
jgi:RimJ/RimL family protein N-acetyltransferase